MRRSGVNRRVLCKRFESVADCDCALRLLTLAATAAGEEPSSSGLSLLRAEFSFELFTSVIVSWM